MSAAGADRPDHGPASAAVLVLGVLAALHPFTGSDLLVLAAALVTAHLCRRTAPRGRPRDPLCAVPFAFVGWAAISSLWSGLPAATLRESLMIGGLSLAAWSAARSLPWPVLTAALARLLRVLLLASVVVAITLPGVGAAVASDGSAAIKGIFVHRNVLGFVAVVALGVFLHAARSAAGSRVLRVFDLLLAAGCLLLAQSQSALVAAVVLVLCAVWSRALAGLAGNATRALVALVGAGLAAALAQLVLSNEEEIIRGLGRDTTLTGRTDVWEAVLDEVRLHPVTGLGWGAAWQDGLPATERMWSAAGFAMYHAHSGYLDVLLQVGVVGCALGAAFLLVALVAAARGAVLRPSPRARWAFATLSSLLVLNVAESYFGSAFGWAVLQFAYFAALGSGRGGPPASPVGAAGPVGTAAAAVPRVRAGRAATW